jgi:hypothetical protein
MATNNSRISPLFIGSLFIALIFFAGVGPYLFDSNLAGAPLGQPQLANPYVRSTRFDRLVLTYYFYWYDWESGMHFYSDDCSDHNAYHPYDQETISYLDPDWHYREFKDMMQAGIDVFLPVFWAGNPGSGQNDSWSKQGVYVMNLALDRLNAEWNASGKLNPLGVTNPVPKVGMFFDTTAMMLEYNAPDPKNASKVIGVGDLTNETHCNTFYQMIRDFYIALDPKYAHEVVNPDDPNAPTGYIVWMYGNNWFARTDQSCIDQCKERFEAEFNHTLIFVGTDGWRNDCPNLEGYYRWGTAVAGMVSYDYSPIRIASLGPGFNNGNASYGAVCQVGQDPILTPRSPEFYSDNWTAAMNADPNWVVIETWNEMHEGTPICRTTEFGDEYLNLTAKYSQIFHTMPIGRINIENYLNKNWEIGVVVVCLVIVGAGAIQFNKKLKRD